MNVTSWIFLDDLQTFLLAHHVWAVRFEFQCKAIFFITNHFDMNWEHRRCAQLAFIRHRRHPKAKKLVRAPALKAFTTTNRSDNLVSDQALRSMHTPEPLIDLSSTSYLSNFQTPCAAAFDGILSHGMQAKHSGSLSRAKVSTNPPLTVAPLSVISSFQAIQTGPMYSRESVRHYNNGTSAYVYSTPDQSIVLNDRQYSSVYTSQEVDDESSIVILSTLDSLIA